MRSARSIGMLAAAVLLLPRAVFAAEPSPAQPALTASQILDHMAANTGGLTTYVVPLHIDAHVKKGALSLPLSLDGERYFKTPDKGALKLHGVPAVAKAFSNMYSSLGNSLTWPQTYNVALESTPEVNGRPVYELRGTSKHSSNVDHVLLDVDAKTFDPIRASWFYRSGATVVLQVQEGIVDGKYRLPMHETVEANFPEYQGNATIDYGSYRTNVPLSDDTFSDK
ncbi:MAG: hypothetical protein ACXVA3_00055 [Vulcanimicrobiaceae bacterium]